MTITTSFATTNSAGEISYYPSTVVTGAEPSQTEDDSGLTRANKIALGVGLGIGLPSCIVSLIGLYIKIQEIRGAGGLVSRVDDSNIEQIENIEEGKH